jgi:hypothetical protein
VTRVDHAYAEEHDVFEAYLAGRLSDEERDEFEAHYFDCEACLRQLEMADDFRAGMRDVAAAGTRVAARTAAAVAPIGLLAALALTSRRQRIAWGAALLLLLAAPVVVIALFMARSRGPESRLAQAPVRSGAAAERIADLEAKLRSLGQTAEGERRQLEAQLAQERRARAAAERAPAAGASGTTGRAGTAGTASPQINVPIFTLAAVRGGSEAGREPVNRIPLAAAGGPLVLTLELAAADYPTYRAALRGAGGKAIWQAGGLRPDDRDTLVLLLPAGMLQPGTYELTLEGLAGNGARGKGVAIGTYSFRVARQP